MQRTRGNEFRRAGKTSETALRRADEHSRRWTGQAIAAAAVMASMLAAGAAHATPGDLDPGFDLDGRVITNGGAGQGYGMGVAIQADGKIVLVGEAYNASTADFAITRYNTDGSADTSFGGDGLVETDFASGSSDGAYAVAIQSDQKIVVAGYSEGAFAVARYNTNGSLDPSFDGDGRVTTTVPGPTEYAQAWDVAIQADGKIVVAGDRNTAGNLHDSVAVRYSITGSLDTGFDGDGIAITDSGANDGFAALALQDDAKIVAAGYSGADARLVRYNTDGSLDTAFDTDGIVTTVVGEYGFANVAIQADDKIVTVTRVSGDIAAVRYNTDGSLDTGFDSDGVATADTGTSAFSRGLAIQPDGRIVVTGETLVVPDGYDIAVVRFDSNGAPDTTFDSDGVGIFGHVLYDSGTAVAIQVDGKLVVGGGDPDFEVLRLGATGSVDNSFDTDGFATTGVGRSYDEGRAVAVQDDGKVVVAGCIANSTCDLAVFRYNTDGSLDTTFDGDGIARTNTLGEYSENVALAVAIDSDGKIVAGGTSYSYVDSANWDLSLVRYNTNGSLDSSFGTGGIVTAALGGPGSADQIRAIAIDSNGKIVVAGYSEMLDGNGDILVARYNTNGTLDPSFDLDGVAIVDVGGWYASAGAVAIQSTGKIVITGNSSLGHVIARFNTNGSLDTSFDVDGTVITPLANGGSALAVLSDGKVLAGGNFDNGSDHDFAVLRYNPNGSLDTTFDGDGMATMDFGGSDGVSALAVQADGSIVTAGSSDDDFGVARFMADGSVDTGFNGDGRLTTDFGGGESLYGMAIGADQKIVAVGEMYDDYGQDIVVARYLVNTCGDGNVELGESCDDGNQLSGDRCDASCMWESDCSPTPLTSCLAASTMEINISKDELNPSKNSLKWNWQSGEAFSQNVLGNPLASTDYRLCVYDSVSELDRLAAWVEIAPSSTRWIDKNPKGFKYKDKTGSEDGASAIKIQPGGADKTRVKMVAKGANLVLPDAVGPGYFHQDSQVVVQFVNSSGTCWTTEFLGDDMLTNTTDSFRAKFN